MGKSKFTKIMKDEFITKFVSNNFGLVLTCDEVGISTTTYYDALAKDKEFKARLDFYKDSAKGLLDTALLKGVSDVDPLVAAKFLELIGRHRSFQALFNIETSDNDSITFKLTKEDFID